MPDCAGTPITTLNRHIKPRHRTSTSNINIELDTEPQESNSERVPHAEGDAARAAVGIELVVHVDGVQGRRR
jgi:hypothetical protein